MDARGWGVRGMLSAKHPVVVLGSLGFGLRRMVARGLGARGMLSVKHPVVVLGSLGFRIAHRVGRSGEALSEYPGVALSCAGVSGATSV